MLFLTFYSNFFFFQTMHFSGQSVCKETPTVDTACIACHVLSLPVDSVWVSCLNSDNLSLLATVEYQVIFMFMAEQNNQDTKKCPSAPGRHIGWIVLCACILIFYLWLGLICQSHGDCDQLLLSPLQDTVWVGLPCTNSIYEMRGSFYSWHPATASQSCVWLWHNSRKGHQIYEKDFRGQQEF